MKAVIFLSVFALAIINVLSTNDICKHCFSGCHYNDACGFNRPTNCTGVDPSLKFRNYMQPELYWICETPYRSAARRCRNDHNFQEEVGDCVLKKDYIVTCPCDTCDCMNSTTVSPIRPIIFKDDKK